MYCAHCGKELVEGANFCSACGSKSKVAERLAASEELATEVSGGVSAALASGRSRSRLRMSPLILLILTLALTAGIAAAAYYVYTEIYLPSVEGSRPAYAPDQEIEFSEPLRSALLPQVDANGDGRIVYSEVEATASLTLPNPEVSNIDELAIFANLTDLDLNGSGVINADLSNLVNLHTLKARDTSLESLDVTGNSALGYLTCPDEADVIGLDSTKLAEHWLITSYYCEGMPSAQIMQGLVTPVTESSMSFAYDETGKLLEKTVYMSDASRTPYQSTEQRTVSYTYDLEGQCISADSSTGYSVLCTYIDGKLSSIFHQSSLLSDSTTLYSYDEQDRLAEIATQDDDYPSLTPRRFEYDETGKLVNASDTVYEYEGDKLVHGFAGTGTDYPFDVFYGYDSSGRWTSVENTSPLFPHIDSWEYDSDGRLVWAMRTYAVSPYNSWSASFVYDDHGNLIERELAYTGERREGVDNLAYSGTVRFTYTRVFAEVDSTGMQAPNWEPIVFANPISWIIEIEPWDSAIDVIDGPLDEILFQGYAS